MLYKGQDRTYSHAADRARRPEGASRSVGAMRGEEPASVDERMFGLLAATPGYSLASSQVARSGTRLRRSVPSADA